MAQIVRRNADGSVTDDQGYTWPSQADFNMFYGGSSGGAASPADVQAATNLLNTPNIDWSSLGVDPTAMAQMAAQNANANLSDLFGYAVNGMPANGTPTLNAAEYLGIINGNPTLAAQEAGGVFGPNMGYLAGKPTLAAEEQLGSINGTPTLDAAKLYGYSGGASGTGTPTVDEQQLNYNTALDAMKTLGALQSNPFAMERVARGFDATGVPNALRGLMSGGVLPGFQAPQAKPQAPSLAGSLGIQNPSQGQGGGPSSADPTSPYFDPAQAAGMNMDTTTATAPAINKLNAVLYQGAPQTVKDFVDSLYESLGYNPATVGEQTKAELPGFTAPRYGVVQA